MTNEKKKTVARLTGAAVVLILVLVALLVPSIRETLARIAGILPSENGSVLFDGEPVDDVPIHKRGAVLVDQNVTLFPHMTVEQNIGFGLWKGRRPGLCWTVPTRERYIATRWSSGAKRCSRRLCPTTPSKWGRQSRSPSPWTALPAFKTVVKSQTLL